MADNAASSPSIPMSEVRADASEVVASATAADPAVDVQVLSPTPGVGPLHFRARAASMTVGQLKMDISDAIPFHPSKTQQRLIYRGRQLMQDHHTLGSIFGDSTFRDGEQQTIHLALKDAPASHPASTPAAPPVFSHEPSGPQPNTQSRNIAGQVPPAVHDGPVLQSRSTVPDGYLAGYQNISLAQQTPQFQHIVEQYGQGHRACSRQTPYSCPGQNVGSHGHDRARGRSDSTGRIQACDTARGPSPLPANTTTASCAFTPRPPYSVSNLQAAIQAADAARATQAMTDAMHRSASGLSLPAMANLNPNAQFQPFVPGVTVSRHGSRAPTPDARPRAVPPAANGQAAGFPRHSIVPEVYLLSSPTGPRGILLNGPSNIYLSPANATQIPAHLPAAMPLFVHQQPGIASGISLVLIPPQVPPFPGQQIPRVSFQRVQQSFQPCQAFDQGVPVHQMPAASPAAIDRPARRRRTGQARGTAGTAGPRRRAHRNQAGLAAVVAALWPHIWLIVRLVLFVWWFTYDNTTWSRWLLMISVAVAVFAFNTVTFQALFNRLWDPVRRHMEELLPRQRDVDNRRPAAAGAGAGEIARRGTNGQLDPAQAAARLVAERRDANANWVMAQMRRVERAGLLFLASIAPGVAERHIARLEAQERREREARRAGEAAEAARPEATHDLVDGAAASATGGGDQGSSVQESAQGPAEASPATGHEGQSGQHEQHGRQPALAQG